jgi:hypothetical protein
MAEADIELFRGDSRTFDLAVTRDEKAIDLSGALSVRVIFKVRSSDTAAVISKSLGGGVAVTDPPNGMIEITFVPGDTSALYAPQALVFDVEVTDSASNVVTVFQGWMLLKRDIAA